MSKRESPKFGRTPWDVLLEFSRRRSFLVWACLIGWGVVIATALAWYHGALPVREASKAKQQGECSRYLHWSFAATTASHEQCSSASLRVHGSAGTKATEMHTRDPSEAVILGVADSFVSAVGCAGFAGGPLSFVIVAGPDQTGTQIKETMLRKLLDAELPRP